MQDGSPKVSEPDASSAPVVGSVAARGAAVTMLGQGGKIVLQLLGAIVLARLLSPTDYGLLAMVLAVIGVGEVFRDFGLSTAAIQSKTLSRSQRDNLFWINSGIGVTLALLVVLFAGPIAALYGHPQLHLIALALSLTFVFNGMVTQFRASLLRMLRFTSIAVIDVTAIAVGLGTGIVFAVLGFGYWALVAQQLAQGLTALIVTVVLSRWLPRFPRRDGDVTPFLRFGWSLAGSNLLNYGANNVDSIIIGTQLGAAPLGVYNRAFQLLTLPLTQLNSPATRVALPVLSRLQDDKERFAAYLIRAQTILMHLLLLIFAFACAQATSLIPLVLGDQWNASIPIFQLLTVGGAFMAMGYATYWVFLARARTGAYLRLALITRPTQIILILVGSLWGVVGVAAAYSIGLALSWALGLVWLRLFVPNSPVREMLVNASRALVGYALAGAASFGAGLAVASVGSVWLTILVGGVALLAAVAVLCLVWPSFRRDLMSILHARKLLLRKREGLST